MNRYKFVGDGAGVPGLPHEISQEEIDLFSPGLKKVFEDALAAGSYELADQAEQPRKAKLKKSEQSSDEGA
jgi:hypothetical protein